MKRDVSQYSRYLVCYFDVLGQKSFMRDVWNSHSRISEAKRKRIGEHLWIFDFIKDQLRRALFVDRRQMESVLMITRGVPYLPTNVLTEDEIVESVATLDCGVEQFSDSFVVYVDAQHPVSALVFSYALYALGMMMPQLHALEVYLRGAITEGSARHVRGGRLMGPALDEAESLELHVANYSRLVFSNYLLKKINAHVGKVLWGWTGDIGYYCLHRYVAVDEDGVGRLAYQTDDFLVDCQHIYIMDCAVETVMAAYRKLYSDVKGGGALESSRLVTKMMRLVNDYSRIGTRVQALRKNNYTPEPYYIDDENIRNVSVGEYYVVYVKLEPMPVVVAKKGSCCVTIRERASGLETARLMEKALETVQSVVRKDPKENKVAQTGIQQIGNYLLVFVRRRKKSSGTLIVNIMNAIASRIPEILASGHGFYVGADCSRGWSSGANCLLGPIVGDVHKLAVSSGRFCRMAISHRFRNALLFGQSEDELRTRWICETDGVWTWRYPEVNQSNARSYLRALTRVVRAWRACREERNSITVAIGRIAELKSLYARLVQTISAEGKSNLAERAESHAVKARLAGLADGRWFVQMALEPYKLSLGLKHKLLGRPEVMVQSDV